MDAVSAARGRVGAGEILVSRSNTEELVGRASLYSGEAVGAVATDLTFRMRPRDGRIDPSYLAGYLSALQLGGFWRSRSSGASSTMKKITRAQLSTLPIPMPPIAEQRRIAAELRERLATLDQMTRAIEIQLEAIDELPAALLRRAFAEIEAA
jgi:restriction endonuclease S subunit